MLLNARSTRRQYIYVKSLNCESAIRFISHSCIPNAAFVKVYNRSSVKVLVRMTKNLYAGQSNYCRLRQPDLVPMRVRQVLDWCGGK
ncbi:hypothetical protein L915_14858 [Phytophthora nicotianae]|uniref:SET domain-containing protein n=1 Tax=Phytophthora nicotianae TaxID=4792 RepID=W2G871_PHYNI|nr:hypothetical protein L915_14858 [Phytophthora nicotianae]